ncbi:hypothetical protein [Priestia megaterium]|nr:hypothetical protein J0P05_14315 [Priestia megaterium]
MHEVQEVKRQMVAAEEERKNRRFFVRIFGR